MNELVPNWPQWFWRKMLIGAALVALLLTALGIAIFFIAGFRSPGDVQWVELAKRQLFAVPLLVGYTIHFALFLLPGACIVLHISKSRTIPPHHLLPATIAASALISYVAFWIYFVAPLVGKVFSFALMGAAACYFVKHRSSQARPLFSQRDVLLPLLLYFFAGLFYLSFLWLYDRALTPDIDAQTRLVHHLPPDNVLPAIFAEKLSNGLSPTPLSGDWLSSDRPPLQTGTALLQRPFRIVRWNYNYQLIGTILQTIWLPMIWCLCRGVGYTERRTAWTLGICLLSGFFLIHSVYVWPKLLAAALVLWAFTLLLEPLLRSSKPSLTTAALAAISAALGFLAHGGVAFTLIALGLFFLLPKYFIGWKQALTGCMVFGLLYLPWSLYQKFYDPPGNRLLKWYLAGVDETTSRGTLDAVKAIYAAQTYDEMWTIRKSNVALLGADLSHRTVEYWQANEFFRIGPALGAVNIGWLGLLLYLVRRRGRSLNSAERSGPLFLAIAFVSLCIWWLLLAGRDLAVIHQGSYATMILLFVGLSGCALFQLPRALQIFAFALHVCNFVFVWMLATPRDLNWPLHIRRVNFIMAFTVCVAVAALLYLFRRTDAAESISETKTMRL